MDTATIFDWLMRMLSFQGISDAVAEGYMDRHGNVTRADIEASLATFDDFCHANDPYEEHDFGPFEVEGETIFFKIDYYDLDFTHHSPDPADPAATERVITIMLANEY